MEITLWEDKIPYYTEGSDTPNSMTAYLVKTWQKVPAIVILPGGAYNVRAVHEGEAIAEYYNQRGYHAFVVNYRLYPNRFPCALADAQRAVKILKKRADELAIDENKIFVIGFSAGGHLASCVATLEDYSKIGDEYDSISPSVTGAILSYAVTSGLMENGSVCDCVSKLVDEDEEMTSKLTTYMQITDKTPPCFIWHTANDAVVPLEHALKFASALRENNVPLEMHIFPDGPHGLGLAKHCKDVCKWPDLSVEWIKNNF